MKSIDIGPGAIMMALLIPFFLGVFSGKARVNKDIKSNEIEGYHCGKITKHISLESAKAQVLAYQTMTRG